jgi:hypothetical protein
MINGNVTISNGIVWTVANGFVDPRDKMPPPAPRKAARPDKDTPSPNSIAYDLTARPLFHKIMPGAPKKPEMKIIELRDQVPMLVNAIVPIIAAKVYETYCAESHDSFDATDALEAACVFHTFDMPEASGELAEEKFGMGSFKLNDHSMFVEINSDIHTGKSNGLTIALVPRVGWHDQRFSFPFDTLPAPPKKEAESKGRWERAGPSKCCLPVYVEGGEA